MTENSLHEQSMRIAGALRALSCCSVGRVSPQIDAARFQNRLLVQTRISAHPDLG